MRLFVRGVFICNECVNVFPFSETMPPKRRTSAAPPAGKRTRNSNGTAINNARTHDIVMSTASMDQLLSLSARELRSQLQACSLLSSGNKAALADRLYHYFHTSSQVPNSSNGVTTVASLSQRTPTETDPSHTDRGVFDPQQFAHQLSDLLRQLTPATLQSGVMQTSVTTTAVATTSDNLPPTTNTPSLSTSSQLLPTLPLNTTNQQLDEVLSAASPIQSLSSAAVNNQTALLNCTLPPTLPALRNQPAAITDNSADVSIHTRYLPPVPPKVRERIIKGEYIDFVTLLPKAMFSSGTEPEGTTSFTFQLPSNSGDISVRPAKKPKSITSFSNWMEAWNIYLAVCVDHMPFRAPSLIAYQRIITSASIQYPLESWLSYDVQFRTLAAADPSLRWDIRHADLWLQCVTQSSAQQSRRWPCPYCGATNHYPERCPFRPYSAQPAPNKQWNANRGQPNTRMSSGTTSTYSNSSPVTSSVLYCKDFNYSWCHRPQCRFVHRCDKCGASHPARGCPVIGHPQMHR